MDGLAQQTCVRAKTLPSGQKFKKIIGLLTI
jgi:hypothetical protein